MRQHFLLRTRAGVVRDHAPTLRRAHVDIGGHHIGHGIAFWGVQFNALNQVVHGTRDGFDFAHMLGVCSNHAIAEHGVKRVSDAVSAQQARAAGVHTNDVFFVCPAGHQPLDIASAQCVVKGRFNVIGGAADGGCLKLGLGQLFPAAEFAQCSQLRSKHEQLGLGGSHVHLRFGVFEVIFRRFLRGIGTLFIQVSTAHGRV